MKFVQNSFGQNQGLESAKLLYKTPVNRKGAEYKSDIPDKSPVINQSKNSLSGLKNSVSKLLNCNKLETKHKFRGERKFLKELRDLKIDDVKAFKEIQVGLDNVEINTQQTLAKHGDKIIKDLTVLENAEKDFSEAEIGFKTARETDTWSRKEKRTTRRNRRKARRAAKQSRLVLRKTVQEFKKPFRKAFKEFQEFHQKNERIKEFVDDQYNLRQDLLNLRVEQRDLAQSLGDTKLIAKRDAAVREATKLFEEAKIAQTNANQLVASSERIINEYKQVEESLQFTIHRGTLYTSKEYPNQNFTALQAVLKSAKMISGDEKERLKGKKNADKYKKQASFSAEQKVYEAAQEELNEARNAEYPDRPAAQKRVRAAEKKLAVLQKEWKERFDAFSVQAIQKQQTLETRQDNAKAKLEQSQLSFNTQLDRIIGKLKDQINASKNEDIVTDSVAQQALQKAKDLRAAFKSTNNLLSIKNLAKETAIITAALKGGVNIDTKKIMVDIKSYQKSINAAKTHKEEVLKEAKEYEELNINEIGNNPFENPDALKKIAKENQKIKEEKQKIEAEQKLKEQKEKNEKNITDLIKSIEEAVKNKDGLAVIVKLFETNTYFLKEIRKSFKKLLNEKAYEKLLGITVADLITNAFKDIDVNIKTNLLNIIHSSGYGKLLQDNIDKNTPKKKPGKPTENNETNEDDEKPETKEEKELKEWNETLEKIELGHLKGVSSSSNIFELGRTMLIKDKIQGFKIDTKFELGTYDTDDLKTWLKDSPYAAEFKKQNKFASLGLWIKNMADTGKIPEVKHTETTAEKEDRLQKKWVKKLSKRGPGSLEHLDRNNALWKTDKANLIRIRDEFSIRDYFGGVIGGDQLKLKTWLKGNQGKAFLNDARYQTIEEWVNQSPASTTPVAPPPSPPVIGYEYETMIATKVPNYVIGDQTAVWKETFGKLSNDMDLGESDFNQLRRIKKKSLKQLQEDFNENRDSKMWEEVSKKIGFIDVKDFKNFMLSAEATRFFNSASLNLTEYLNEKLLDNVDKKLQQYDIHPKDHKRFDAANSVGIYKMIEQYPDILDGGKICDSFRSLLNLPDHRSYWHDASGGAFKLRAADIQTFINHRGGLDGWNRTFDDDLTTFEHEGDDDFEVEGTSTLWNNEFHSVANFFTWLRTGRND